MNEEHFRFYWLYILDLKKSIDRKNSRPGNVSPIIKWFCNFYGHQVANPTCPERQALILAAKSAEEEVESGVETDLENVIAAMKSTGLEEDELHGVFCSCTRKFSTTSCNCKKSSKLCDKNCHPKNYKCTNC